MSDRQIVERVTYTLEVSPYVDYSTALPVELTVDGFTLRLENQTLTATPTEEFPTEQAAREALEPFLKSWEIKADLVDGTLFRFHFQSCSVVQTDTQGRTHHVTANERSHMTDMVVALSRDTFPEPAPYDLSDSRLVQDLLRCVKDAREGGYLLVNGYLLLTRLEFEYAGKPGASAAIGVAVQVLRKLGELSSVNDPVLRRKAKGPERPLSDAEKAWLGAALPRIVLNVAIVEAGGIPPPITMGELPALP
jgi:hypothetical protein